MSAPDRRVLAARLLAARRQAATGRGVRRLPRDGRPVACSAEQRRVWLADRIGGPSAAPPVTAGLALDGPLDLDRLAAALAAVVDRHPVLRTRYAEVDGEPVQLLPERPMTDRQAAGLLDVLDLAYAPESEREPLAAALAVEAGSHPFDLAVGPLLRLTVLRLAPDRHRLLLVCHHIAADARSVGLLTAELATAYRTGPATAADGPAGHERAGRGPAGDGPQYADYAVWSRERLDRVLPERLAYWRHLLDGAPPVLELGLDRPQPGARPGRRAATVAVRFPAGVVERLRPVGEGARLTGHTVLLAGFLVLLARCAGRREVTVGVVSGGRPHPELDAVVGCFTELLPLRVSLADDPAFRAFAPRVREALAAGLAQAAPFDRIVSAAAPRRAPGVHPLFQVLFVERADGVAVAGGPESGWGPGLDSAPWGQEVDATGYDLVLAAGVGPELAELVLTYPCDRFARSAVAGFADALVELLTLLSERPDAALSTVRTAEPWRSAAAPNAAAPPGPRTPGPRRAELPGPVTELRALWGEVLGRDGIGEQDDLFALGGDSLAVVRIAARITEQFGVDVPASAFFDSPTPAGFGAVLARLTEEHQHV
ncbi:condensation domain-containing protein [Streptomyces sp. TLI_171]|uniref:condensation domain-containing protein n=1 Tax=Streptomyces sp. TLI_171 TaxID=1938859 RepID=UPI000C17C8CA|nr:condensation domain-containing protein [Streptomyces sp. TLI_171]RKE21817.1 phosphopantetheine binding protein [Streptomyces sp. TLI_171]